VDNLLRDLLIRHEGMRLKPYRDIVGKLTIGIGRNLTDVGISKVEALVLLASDIERCEREAATFPWFSGLTQIRKYVILSMLFNLGLPRFLKFEKMLHALSGGAWEQAAVEMLNSQWSKQVGSRAQELAYMMRHNDWMRV